MPTGMTRWKRCYSWLVGVAVSAAVAPACAREVYAPPARAFPLESKWTVPAGEMAVQGQASLSTAVLGPGIVDSSVGVRRGVNERLEVSASGAIMHVARTGRSDAHSNIYAARVGTLLDLETAMLAFSGGLGAGYAPAGGGFASIDAGLVGAYENCVLVPFGAGRFFASVPFATKPVDISKRGQAPGTRMDRAENTFGLSFSGGLEIPLDQQCQSRASILMGVGVTLLGDGNSGEIFTNAGLGFQMRL